MEDEFILTDNDFKVLAARRTRRKFRKFNNIALIIWGVIGMLIYIPLNIFVFENMEFVELWQSILYIAVPVFGSILLLGWWLERRAKSDKENLYVSLKLNYEFKQKKLYRDDC